MENSIDIFKKNLEIIINDADCIDLKQFTYDLLDCIYVDIVCEQSEKVSKIVIEGYENEVKNSIDVFNPEYKEDIEVLEKLLKELDYYLEFGTYA